MTGHRKWDQKATHYGRPTLHVGSERYNRAQQLNVIPFSSSIGQREYVRLAVCPFAQP